MNKQSKGKIFLADERGCTQADWYRTYSTFNFLEYYNQHKTSFAGISAFNDNTLAAGRSLIRHVEQPSFCMLLPVVGDVGYKDNFDNSCLIKAGQLHVCFAPKGAVVEMVNPLEESLVSFIEVWIEADNLTKDYLPSLFDFDLNENKNKLIPLTSGLPALDNAKSFPLVTIGKFEGRQEAVYQLRNEQSKLFVFIIEGVFEVQGRLLHIKDGLGLWSETEEIELEALSNDAIVLLIENQ